MCFVVFKTIELGAGPTNADGFCKAFEEAGVRVEDWANDILRKPAFSVATEKMGMDLVIVSVAELGFTDSAKLKDIYISAKKRGLGLCPPEVGPQLRLQYKDQPKEEVLLIGMESICASDDVFDIFKVSHFSSVGLYLSTGPGGSNDVWPKDYQFVFVLPRKPPVT